MLNSPFVIGRVHSGGDRHSDASRGSRHLAGNVQNLHHGWGIAAALLFVRVSLLKRDLRCVSNPVLECLTGCRCTVFARVPEPWRSSPPVPTSFALLRSLRRYSCQVDGIMMTIIIIIPTKINCPDQILLQYFNFEPFSCLAGCSQDPHLPCCAAVYWSVCSRSADAWWTLVWQRPEDGSPQGEEPKRGGDDECWVCPPE